ncbi:MAG: ATP-binding cassette domain-containing protein [Lachnospiraceae bacterium]|nr:ATP-binding cassette domain-containing protein [Lachnospiraceae bacterium]
MSLLVDIEKKLGDFSLKVDLEADKGITGILGASGCGKSLTLKCIAGIEKPDKGRIVLDGQVLFDSELHIDLPPQKRNVGYLFQSYALFPHMTVRQNILCGMGKDKSKTSKKEALARVVRLLSLEGTEQLYPGQLSGGQAQRTALARILVSGPKILMLDEPFSALDTHLRERLQIEMKSLLSDLDETVLMVTHSRDEAYHMCSRLAVMDAGRLQDCRETKNLFGDPVSICAARLTGCKNIAPAVKKGDYLVEIPDWGICLTTASPVKDGLKAVGIRAHYFNAKTDHNSFPVLFTADMEEPFEWVLEFRYPDQAPDTPSLWWRIPKDRVPGQRPKTLGIAPANVLLLYE